MKRSSIIRKPSTKPKTRKCAECPTRFILSPQRPTQRVCESIECLLKHVERNKEKDAKKAAKAERMKDAARRDAITPMRDRLARLQVIVNQIVNLRDRFKPCISCDKPWIEGEVRHASHFKSIGSNSALRFNFWNLNTSCSACNWKKAGNIQEYEPRLRIKIGNDKVDFLKNHPRSREYTVEWVNRATKIANKKLRRLKKRIGI